MVLDIESLKLDSQIDLEAIINDDDNSEVRRNGRFIKGPLPIDWLVKARSAGSPALQVGLIIWYLQGLNQPRMKRRAMISLSNIEFKKWGMSRITKRRGIDQLEAAKLIRVKRIPYKNPQITILQADGWL